MRGSLLQFLLHSFLGPLCPLLRAQVLVYVDATRTNRPTPPLHFLPPPHSLQPDEQRALACSAVRVRAPEPKGIQHIDGVESKGGVDERCRHLHRISTTPHQPLDDDVVAPEAPLKRAKTGVEHSRGAHDTHNLSLRLQQQNATKYAVQLPLEPE